MINAVIIDEKDNVAVAIEEISKNNEINFKLKDKTIKTITALDDITIYHKLAIKDMAEGDKVTKYGEHIGEANQEIKIGQHVHIHNVKSVREDLDKQIVSNI
ncbi:UxaA family hydrolase [Clostridioides sp. ES-S-0005-03]|uniref:UxaA family hydrolase n=1 Tax=Clostridioides sp. ES-S-0005-03 TaxID=2770774 RepID=UPI001D10F574|nr:UxaA family hydrolase [Clostridioides sp. ES-S-0005-03]UDN46913.1 UxaA family hydrolase [Clostridioides sp. ES-S-0173-01]